MPIELYALPDAIAKVEARLGEPDAAVADIVELAWHLRQRDSRRALSLVEQAATSRAGAADSEVRVRIDLIRAEIAALQGQYGTAEERLAEAQAAPVTNTDDILAGDAAMTEALVAHAQGRRERYFAAWAHAAERYTAAGDTLRSRLARAWPIFLTAHSDRAAAAAAQAALRAEAPEPRHPALDALLCAADGTLQFAQAVAASAVHAMRASHHAREAGLIRHAIVSAMNSGIALLNLGIFDEAAAAYDWAAERARETGWTPLIGVSLTRLGGLLRELGQLERSEAVLREALATLVRVPGGIIRAELHAALANTVFLRGDAAQAVGLAQTAISGYREETSIDGITTNLILLARAQTGCGDSNAAQAALDEAAELVEAHHNERLRSELLEARAELHAALDLAPPEDMRAPNAQIHYLEAALAAGRALEGWQPPPRLLLALGHAWKNAGHADTAFAYAEQALSAEQQAAARRAANVSALMQARADIERERAEAAHQRELAQALAARAQTLEAANATLERLGEIGRGITATLDAQQVFAALHARIADLIEVASFSIFRLDADGATLHRVFGIEAGTALPPVRIALSDPARLTARCAREQREIVLDDAAGVGVVPSGQLAARAALFAPLLADTRLLGVMTVQALTPRAYGERERAIFRTLCAYGAIALANAETQAKMIQAEKMASLGQLVANVAHEVNTPIAAIKTVGNGIARALERLRATQAEFDALEPETRLAFAGFAAGLSAPAPSGGGREERARAAAMRAALTAAGIADAEPRARALARICDLAQLADALPLLRHPQAAVLLERAMALAAIAQGSGTINASVERVSKIVFALKTYARHDSARQTQWLDLRESIEGVLTLYQSALRQGIELVRDYHEVPRLRGVPEELAQVWVNLIHNAVQAMQGRGTLRLALLALPEAIRVEVGDTGCGIAERLRARVFEPFFTTKPAGEGSGLGLDIARRIVRAHGGEIDFSSTPGLGTTFAVTLPIDPA